MYFGYDVDGIFNIWDGVNNEVYKTLSEWNANTYFNPKDTDSEIIGENWYEINSFVPLNISNNLIKNGKFEKDMENWNEGWDSLGQGAVKSKWCNEFGGSGSLEMFVDRDHKLPQDILTYSNEFEIKNGVKYGIKFSLLSNDTESIPIVIE